jgi:hypothetical protein
LVILSYFWYRDKSNQLKPYWFGLDGVLKINRTKPNHMHFYLAIKMIFIFKTESNRTANIPKWSMIEFIVYYWNIGFFGTYMMKSKGLTMRKWGKSLLIAYWMWLFCILLWTLCKCTHQESEQLHEPKPRGWKHQVLAWKIHSLGLYTQVPTSSNPSPIFITKIEVIFCCQLLNP